jgi:hypothetical protein
MWKPHILQIKACVKLKRCSCISSSRPVGTMPDTPYQYLSTPVDTTSIVSDSRTYTYWRLTVTPYLPKYLSVLQRGADEAPERQATRDRKEEAAQGDNPPKCTAVTEVTSQQRETIKTCRSVGHTGKEILIFLTPVCENPETLRTISRRHCHEGTSKNDARQQQTTWAFLLHTITTLHAQKKICKRTPFLFR